MNDANDSIKLILTEEEARVLYQAMIQAHFFGKDVDIAVELVYKLTKLLKME